jgi:hypothetical protein
MRLPEGGKGRVACQMLKRGGGIDQAAVGEDPTGCKGVHGALSESERDGLGERRRLD